MIGGPSRRIAVFSRGLVRLPHLRAFLGAESIVWRPGRRRARKLDAVAGWGMRPTAGRARGYAAEHDLPYWAIEDGFLRSLRLGSSGTPPLSLIVDDCGVYYDAGRPSRLEHMLNEDPAPELVAQAEELVSLIRRDGLSKYNAAPPVDSGVLPPTTRRRVLVVDQTRDDMAVLLGGADASSFADMMRAAVDENRGAEIIVKLHPETIAGRKRGYLSEMPIPDGVRMLDRDVNPLDLVRRCERVYTVSSQLGLEALLAGVPVSCHGMPFYAGWGATADRLTCSRRERRRSPLEIFAAAYLRYARYVDPVSGERCCARRAVDLLATARSVNEANRGTTICLGMQRWKRAQLRPFVTGTGGRAVFARNGRQALRKGAGAGDRILVWGEREPPGLSLLESRTGTTAGRVEDGFLRSVGLGSDFVRPFSLTVDWQGAHYDPGRPSDLEVLLAGTEFTPELRARAASLRRRIVQSRLSKYNIGRHLPPRPPAAAGKRIVLVPGQVEDDVSVQCGCADIRTNLALVQVVRESVPDAFIAYKPHPDIVARNRRRGGDMPLIRKFIDADWSGAAIHDCLSLADEVHTLSSLTGFEALLRGKVVATYGGPFYAGWGLTRDRLRFARRTRRLTIDELVAGALILYPRYYDWESDMVCDCEAIVERLAGRRTRSPAPADAGPLLRPDRLLQRLGRYLLGWAHA